MPSALRRKKAKAWWWNWKVSSALPASAASQPPEYHFQETPLSLRRSPMVGASSSGTSWPLWPGASIAGGCGLFTV